MTKSPKEYRIQVRLSEDEYFEATSEAALAGIATSTHLRNTFVNRHASKAPGGLGALSPNRDFAAHLATAMALTIITGSHATEGLEDQVERKAHEIMVALGAA